MPQVYTADFLSENEVIEEQYPDTGDNLRLRNGRARFLRKTGWSVQCGTSDLTDLARCKIYWLIAIRPKE